MTTKLFQIVKTTNFKSLKIYLKLSINLFEIIKARLLSYKKLALNYKTTYIKL